MQELRRIRSGVMSEKVHAVTGLAVLELVLDTGQGISRSTVVGTRNSLLFSDHCTISHTTVNQLLSHPVYSSFWWNARKGNFQSVEFSPG